VGVVLGGDRNPDSWVTTMFTKPRLKALHLRVCADRHPLYATADGKRQADGKSITALMVEGQREPVRGFIGGWGVDLPTQPGNRLRFVRACVRARAERHPLYALIRPGMSFASRGRGRGRGLGVAVGAAVGTALGAVVGVAVGVDIAASAAV
jgi:hypothetical protein